MKDLQKDIYFSPGEANTRAPWERHSPAPWCWSVDDGGRVSLFDANGSPVSIDQNSRNESQSATNARIIENSPEAFGLLCWMSEILAFSIKRHGRPTHDSEECLLQSRALIAKARDGLA